MSSNLFTSLRRVFKKKHGSAKEQMSDELLETLIVDPRHLFFGQQHTFTIEYFQKKFATAWTRIPITESPHYLFVAGDEQPYRDYLSQSWRYFYGNDIPSDKIEEKVTEFRNLIVNIKQAGAISQPLKLYWAADGDMMIADGNHRASIAAFLGFKCPVHIKKTEQQVKNIIAIPDETYGSSVMETPYQTIYHGRQILLKGRRDDLITRFDAINNVFPLKGKSLLDFGANYGMSSYLALRLGGVRTAHLVEASRDITQAAIRLSVVLNNPDKTFTVGDLRNDLSEFLPVCDVGFCFSISFHVGDIDNLANMLRSNVKEAVFYETHEGRDLEPQIAKKFTKHRKLCELGRRQLFMLSN